MFQILSFIKFKFEIMCFGPCFIVNNFMMILFFSFSLFSDMQSGCLGFRICIMFILKTSCYYSYTLNAHNLYVCPSIQV